MQRRLSFEELLAQQLSLSKLRLQMQKQAAVSVQPNGSFYKKLISNLEFSLTNAQKRVIKTVHDDLKNDLDQAL